MSWLLPVLAIPSKGSRAAYFRDYHARNLAKRRPYLARKARAYRAARKEAA